MTPHRKTLLAAAAFAFLSTGALAQTTDLTGSTSCLTGMVPSSDWAEVSQNFRESLWDRRAGALLFDNNEILSMAVVDINGNEVCTNENTTGRRTRCDFRLNPSDEFFIRVDNPSGYTGTFRVCAF